MGGTAALASALQTDLRLGLCVSEGPPEGAPQAAAAAAAEAPATATAAAAGKHRLSNAGEGGPLQGPPHPGGFDEVQAALMAARRQAFGENVLPQRPPTRTHQTLNPKP